MVATFLTTFGVCLVGALVPIVNSEIYLVGASALLPPAQAPVLVGAAALGQMVGKSALYFAGRGALQLRWGRLRDRVEAVRARYQSGSAAPALGATVLLASAGAGIPPFYVVTVACGIFRVPYLQFFLLGLLGMLGRFSVVVVAPQLFKAWGQ